MPPTVLAEYRQEKRMEMFTAYMDTHKCDKWSVFATAYFIHYKCFDKYQCQSDLDRFNRDKSTMPDYVVSYLILKQNGFGRGTEWDSRG